MNLNQFQKEMSELGKQWAKGKKIQTYDLGEKKITFLPNQAKFINSKKRFVLSVGGYGSGKSLTLAVKMILMCLCYPNNTVLLGRKHLSDLDLTVLPDLFDLMYSKWYTHRVKDGIIKFFNGSKIVLFGLDALQEGSLADIKKAQQKIKGLNLGAYFIDQLEEVERDVFFSLNSRLRRKDVPWRQGNMTCNPANFWAYDFFKANPAPNTEVVESSMVDNKANLPADYIEDQLNHDENYVKRFVYGEWTPEIMTEKAVFAQEYIKRFVPRVPVAVEEGCEIYEEPKVGVKYQIGVDPSEGSVDPSSISVVADNGTKVAKYNGKIPISALGEKVKFLYYKYNKPLIIPEANASGQALLLQIRDLRVFERKVYDEKFDKDTSKLGWKTSYQSKQALISNFQELLRADFPKIYDQKTINEFMTFVWSDSAQQKGAGAQRNFHDDDVMSTLLAYWQLNPSIARKKKIRRLKPIRRKRFQYL
jgi:hypothetical protein